MIISKWKSLISILDESPFFTGLSIKERERLVQELLHTYPQLHRYNTGETEVGYEASWLMNKSC